MIPLTFPLVIAAIVGSATPADAQYFGRNKVQYERFDFKVVASEHFDVYYYPEEEAAVQLATRMAERWYQRLSKLLNHELTGRQPLILYAAHPHFQQTNILEGEISEGTGGVTEGTQRRVILPFAGGLAETDHVLGHELVHAFQYDLAAQRDFQGRPTGPAIGALPLWFIEGMAEYLSLGPVDANTAMWVREAAAREGLPTIERLDDPDFFPYRYGHAFWAYVGGRYGDGAVGDLLRATGPQGDIEGAIASVLGTDSATLTSDWHEATRRAYAPFFETTQRPEAFARAVITSDGGGGEMNLAPAVSPDGRRVVFLSERSLFSIDMYLAEVATGRIIRKLSDTAGDPHFDSLEFLNSAGDWAPDNRRFVFSALSKGQPVLTILDVDRGRREREEVFRDLGEIFNPAWSPDGGRIAFSALTGGVLDLYVFDLQSSALQRLTDDPFADLDPEWSSDGRSLAWVTDRFSSDLATLSFGNYRIGLIDVATRAMRPLAGFERGRNTNPEFSADGRTLYFIATPDGIPNVYRSSNGVTRITNVLSGVSGITPLTPALSVASASPGLLFTIFEEDRYNIYTIANPAAAAIPGSADAGRDAAVLPPVPRATGEVLSLLAAPALGLPAPAALPQQDYRARLKLDAISQPTIGVGADQFGAYAAGGIAFLFSDVLGDYMLGANVQLTNRFEEAGASLMFLNRKQRWNWGFAVEQTPFVTGSFAQGQTTFEGQTAFVEQSLRVTQVNRGASALAQYPFSRVHRLELSAGARRISFDRRIETQYFSPFTGGLIAEGVEKLPSAEALNLGEGTAALVYDSSIAGPTSPVLGQRYRLEYSQMAGSLLYSGVLTDYRRYFLPARPFTIAVRGLHYGRYGRDAEDVRLPPLSLGFPGLVRGYEFISFAPDQCASGTAAGCDDFDQLIGSRIAAASAEFRFPLLGLFSRRSYYGPFPLEFALFSDAGTAWTSDVEPTILGGDRGWIRSAGAALRANVFGYAVVEVDYVRPLDRSGRGWVWQFNLMPGF